MMTDGTPLCVDLDGTLIAGDTLVLSLRQIATRMPLKLAAVALALFRGRAAFKRTVSDAAIPDPQAMPWRNEVVAFVRAEHASGRRVILATAADRRIADAVASFLACFSDVIASDGITNAKGEAKIRAIRQLLGDRAPFDYIGDSRADLPIFATARIAYLVAPDRALHHQVADVSTIGRIFDHT
ncbi:MAG: hypothetical protein MNPFHGCM_02004 [Gemmatimonadaceae bacterium]|nr:hypothetical protein [Gemmatimonadaceae bacterium]